MKLFTAIRALLFIWVCPKFIRAHILTVIAAEQNLRGQHDFAEIAEKFGPRLLPKDVRRIRCAVEHVNGDEGFALIGATAPAMPAEVKGRCVTCGGVDAHTVTCPCYTPPRPCWVCNQCRAINDDARATCKSCLTMKEAGQ